MKISKKSIKKEIQLSKIKIRKQVNERKLKEEVASIRQTLHKKKHEIAMEVSRIEHVSKDEVYHMDRCDDLNNIAVEMELLAQYVNLEICNLKSKL